MNSERISDEQISAWVDGELDAAQRARVEAWLQDHPEDATRAAVWAADRQALQALFGPVVDEPVPASLTRTVWRRHGGMPRWAMAASAAGLLVLGALGGGAAVWQQQRQQLAQAQVRLAAGTEQGWV